MSDAGAIAAAQRRQWAAAGGSHDRMIGLLRILLPIGIVVLVALLASAPFLGGRDISFVLAKDRVALAPERMRVTDANYRGQDSNGQPFQLRAVSAVQQSSKDPIVRMKSLSARIALDDGPAVIVARTGRYDMDTQRIAIDGQVLVHGPDNYKMQTRDVIIDMNSRKVASRGPVDGNGDFGKFRANLLTGDLNTRVVNLVGAVRLQIPRRPFKAQP